MTTLARDEVVFEAVGLAEGLYTVCHGACVYSYQQLPTRPKKTTTDAGKRRSAAKTCTEYVKATMWISEASLWLSKWEHCGHMSAIKLCQMLFLHKDEFVKEASEHGHIHSMLRDYAISFQ